ncbi:putative membrane-fusion protein [Anaplasma centrale str. Israel]|uniref:Putative membrane-fusion protein n=1 Tax=Anaplasma centrale (strain Israel) TaxID=574556 RepID=D1AUC3_ANACI|nr:efflux RND transporter periplasmic adaptor subunit [Anaplasma centrale]ACZ49151.1 putative membrane-fusion protein [Anaplasma centrale str. Israel]
MRAKLLASGKVSSALRNLLQVIVHLKLRYKLSGCLLVVCALWLLSGLVIPSAAEHDIISGFQKLPAIIRVEKLRAEDREFVMHLTGEVHASEFMDIMSEVSGKVERVIARSGSKVESGQVILEIEECGRVERLRQAEALLKQRQLERDASESLSSTGYRSEAQDNAALVALMAAAADLKHAQIELRNTRIRAPFSGIIGKIVPQAGSFVNSGQTIAQIASFDRLRVVSHVSEKSISKLKLHGPADVVLGSGEVLRGSIAFVGRIASPGTKTYMIEVLADNKSGVFVTEGMAASVRVPIGKFKTHKISSSSLSLDDTGAVGVKALVDNTVQFFEVEIVDDLGGQLWVSGVPDDVSLIARGHEYVTVGTEVNL